MTRDELRGVLEANRVSQRSYSLDSAVVDDAYCLERSGAGWAVYYFERGNRNDERWFATEAEAHGDLLTRVLAAPSTRTR